MVADQMTHIRHQLDEGRLEEALEMLRKASRDFPAHAPLYILLAETSDKLGRHDEAMNAWQHAWFLVPNSVYIRQNLERAIARPVLRTTLVQQSDASQQFQPDFEKQQPLKLPLHATFAPPPLPAIPSTRKPGAIMPPPLPSSKTKVMPPPLPEALAPEPQVQEPIPQPEPAFAEDLAPALDATLTHETSPLDMPVFAQLSALEQPKGFEVQVEYDWRQKSATKAHFEEVSWHTLQETFSHLEPEIPEVLVESPKPIRPDPGFDNLDDLISQLENAPRIVPNPELFDDYVPDEGDTEDMVSETLARIYTTQKNYKEAELVYLRLAEMQPERADYFLEQIEGFRDKL